jgi:uncharacterized membrane protein
MFGIPGLDPLGVAHSLFGIAALLLGLIVLLIRKGTRVHRRIGLAYGASMLLLNGTALMIYDLFGHFGPFHVAALVSLATVVAAFVPVLLRRPQGTWMKHHAALMCWSWVGLTAALLSEVATHLPGMDFGFGVVAATIAVVIGGAIMIRTRVPRIVAALAPKAR